MKYTTSRIYERRNRDGQFYGVLSYNENGRYKEKTHKLKSTTKKAAKLELEEWRQAEEQKAINTEIREHAIPKFQEYAQEIIDYRREMKEVSGSRYHDYTIILATVKNNMPDKPLNEYTNKDIETLYRKLRGKGKSNHTLHKTHYFLKMVFTKAIREELIIKDPMLLIKTPKKENLKTGINSLSEQGAKDFLEIVKHMPPTIVRMATLLAFYTGMRRGECCALRWIDVDFEHKVINVRHGIGKSYENNAYELKGTKTHKKRDIAIPEALLRELKEWKKLQEDERFVLGMDGAWCNPDYIGKKYMAIIEALGIKGIEGRNLTFHDLRHTYATLTIAKGADVVSVASQLGHADVSMTLNTYAGVLPQAKKQVASIMDDLSE